MTRNLKTVNISVKMHTSFEYFFNFLDKEELHCDCRSINIEKSVKNLDYQENVKKSNT